MYNIYSVREVDYIIIAKTYVLVLYIYVKKWISAWLHEFNELCHKWRKTDLVFFIFLPGESKYEQQRYMYTHSIKKKKNEKNSSPEINSHNTHRRHF